MRNYILAFMLGLSACFCPDPDPDPDMGVVVPDATDPLDGSRPMADASKLDLGMLADSGMVFDSGIGSDVGGVDAGSPDSGDHDTGVLPVDRPGRVNIFGSVEPIPNPAVLYTQPLRALPLDVRVAFAECVLACGVFDDVREVLERQGAITASTAHSLDIAVTAGGFNGETNPTFGFVFEEAWVTSTHEVLALANALGYVLSQGSVFLLDGDGKDASGASRSIGFDANYAIVEWAKTPTIGQSAAFFALAGDLDSDVFSTPTSGYTQYGIDYLTLQSAVSEERFIAAYLEAAAVFKLAYTDVVYTPVVDGTPTLFRGSAAFLSNDWMLNASGEEYLDRLPVEVHEDLKNLRLRHLRAVQRALDAIDEVSVEFFANFSCEW